MLDAVASLLRDATPDLLRLTLTVEQDFHEEEYGAQLWFFANGEAAVTSFVSKYAYSLLGPGAEVGYDHQSLDKFTAIQRSFGSTFFRDLSSDLSLARHLDRPLKTDWREYETEEEKAEFHKRLGARPSSHFLNLRVDGQVTWPKEPTKIAFGGHNFVLFPQTRENSHSISIDLTHEHLSAEDARSLINRMLSVMSWCNDQPASLHEGWSGNPVPKPVPQKNLAPSTAFEWHFYRSPPTDEKLMRCLAFYRDGLNALSSGLASHAVLSFFRVFETKYDNKIKVIRWIDSVINLSGASILASAQAYETDRLGKGLGHGDYVYLWCRVATAHAARDAPSDPDGADETQRLLNGAKVIRQLARHFIRQEFKFPESYLSDVAK